VTTLSFAPTVRPLLDALDLRPDGTDTFVADPQVGRARLYSRDGTLLASVLQDGVVRLP
jgi:hypothetical protein